MTIETIVVLFCIFLFSLGLSIMCWRESYLNEIQNTYAKIWFAISLLLTTYFGILILTA